MRLISEVEFRETFTSKLTDFTKDKQFDYVVGPGRSGAIAAVYASHHLGIPFVPYKSKIPDWTPLIVDTASQSGKTLRKASNVYGGAEFVYAFHEEKGEHFRFWYEELSLVRGKGNEYLK